jgi:TolB-like protein
MKREKSAYSSTTPRKTGTFVTCGLMILIFALALTSVLSGCSKRYSNLPPFSAIPLGDSFNYSVGRFKTSYLADQIHAYYRGTTNGPLAVTTFVSLDRIQNSSTFGRILGEQLMSELAMKGYDVIELRLADAMQVAADEGELGLSRDMRLIRNAQNVTGIVVGTYAVSPDNVFVNARLIDPASSLIVSAGSIEMPRTDEISRLLRANSFPQSLERIPVRHLGYLYPLPYANWSYGMPMGPYGNGDPSEEDEPATPTRPKLETPSVKPTLPKSKLLTEPSVSAGS